MNGTEHAEALAALYGGGLPKYPNIQAIDPLPGIYRAVPEGIYHEAPGVSKSDLDKIARTPKHYWAAKLDPNRWPKEDTQAQLVGRAVHCAVLEPDEYAGRFAEGPAERRSKADKETVAELEAKGYTVLRPSEVEHVEAIRESVHAHPAAAMLLGAGETEVSAWWRDEATGELCKCRPDLVRPDNILVDLKKTKDASPQGFLREAYNYRYHVQAAYYSRGWEAAAGVTVPAFIWIAVEPEPPYAVAVYAADADQMELGRQAVEADLHTYHVCRLAGEWPAYSDEIQTLGVPPWAKKHLGSDDE